MTGIEVAAAAAIAGAATSAVGTIAAGNAASANSSYQAQVAANNATIAKQNADYAAKAGEVAATKASLASRAQGAGIKAAEAANNVDVNSGSALDVQVSQRELGKLDTETTANNALLTAYGYRTQGTNFEAQSGLDTAEAEQAPVGAAFGATGSLLSSASGISTKWGGGDDSTLNPYVARGPNTDFAVG